MCVDDLITTRNGNHKIKNLETQSKANFEVKDLEKQKYFQGMKVSRSKDEVIISQRKYTPNILRDTTLACRPTSTPLE